MPELMRQPTARQAGRAYLLLLVLLVAGGALLAPRIGIGANLWVNELVYILLPPVWLAWRGRWEWREIFRVRPISPSLFLHCSLIGALLWVFNGVLYATLERLTGQVLGRSPLLAAWSGQLSPLQIVLLLLGLVVLAPICEEFFFRGFLQRAYEAYGGVQGLVVAGVLFGAMHILNGMNNLLPATLIGLALGYLAYCTGSIWAAVALHAGNNLMSRIGVALCPALATGGSLSAWTYGLAVAAGLLGLSLLMRIGRTRQLPEPPPQADRPPLVRSLSLWMAALLLLFILGSEIALRAGWLDAIMSATTPTVINVGELNGELPVLYLDVADTDLGKCIKLRFHLEADSINSHIRLKDPSGAIVWEGRWQGNGLTLNSEEGCVQAAQSGKWLLLLQGDGQGIRLQASWRLQR